MTDPRDHAGTDERGLRDALDAALRGPDAHEPGMPDLLGPAMAQGARIRRRRRTTFLVALSVGAVIAGAGTVGGIAYLGRSDDPGVGVAGQPSGSPPPTEEPRSASELVAVLMRHLDPQGLSVDPYPVTVYERPGTRHVLMTVRSLKGPSTTLDLSVAALAPPGLTGSGTSGCGVLEKLDRSTTVDYTDPGVACELLKPVVKASDVWTVVAKKPSAPGTQGAHGVVRLGPDLAIVRAWIHEKPSAELDLGTDLLAAIARDTDLDTAIARVPASDRGPSAPPAPVNT